MIATDEDLVRRAMAAYYRAARGAEILPIPANTSGAVEHDGKLYVELHNVNGTLAVYRVRPDGILKRLRRWPQEIDMAP